MSNQSTREIAPEVASGLTFTTMPEFIVKPTVSTSGDYADFYQENGYLVVPDALSPDELDELRAETLAICQGERGEVRGFEPNVPGETEADVLRRYLCIHFPHKISPIMTKYLGTPAMTDILTQLVGPNVKCMQSMLFIKATGKPGQAWHQDEYFIPTRDRSLVGGWIAMDDATIENGCLWIISGSHKPGIIYPQWDHEDHKFDCAGEAYRFPYSDADSIPVEVKAGTIVFFNGYVLHRSFPNRAQSGYRRVLVNHYMNANSLLPWHSPQNGEHMAVTDYRDIIMIAGEDPYAYKGVEERATPSVRPSGEGGCEAWRSKEKREKI
ncbi:MAG: phytanoyl-CoA dioxygenase family protein [Chloroflexota bacterium]